MSGGSHNYMYSHDIPSDTDLEEMLESIKQIHERHKTPAVRQAMFQTMRVQKLKEALEQEIKAVRDFWHEVEWFEDGDSSIDAVIGFPEECGMPHPDPEAKRTYCNQPRGHVGAHSLSFQSGRVMCTWNRKVGDSCPPPNVIEA